MADRHIFSPSECWRMSPPAWHRWHVGQLASYHSLSKARHPADLILLFLEITEASLGGSISEYIIQSWIWCLGCTGSEVTYQSRITAGGNFITLSPQVSFAHNLDWKVKMKMLSKFIKIVSQGRCSLRLLTSTQLSLFRQKMNKCWFWIVVSAYKMAEHNEKTGCVFLCCTRNKTNWFPERVRTI